MEDTSKQKRHSQDIIFLLHLFIIEEEVVMGVTLTITDITQVSLISLFYPNLATFQSSIMDLKNDPLDFIFGVTIVDR